MQQRAFSSQSVLLFRGSLQMRQFYFSGELIAQPVASGDARASRA